MNGFFTKKGRLSGQESSGDVVNKSFRKLRFNGVVCEDRIGFAQKIIQVSVLKENDRV